MTTDSDYDRWEDDGGGNHPHPLTPCCTECGEPAFYRIITTTVLNICPQGHQWIEPLTDQRQNNKPPP